MQTFKKEKRNKKSSASVRALAKEEGESARNMWASMRPKMQESAENIMDNVGVHEQTFLHDHSCE